MRVAAIHFGKTADVDVNEDNLIALNIRAATEYQANLIVNPEQSIMPMPSDSSLIAVNSNADDIARSRAYAKTFAFERGPQMVKRFVAEVAEWHRCYVVVSLITADPEHHMMFNSALVLGPRTDEFPDGIYHTYHKSVLYGDIYAVKGASPLQPVKLDIGNVGVLICADYSLPLMARSLMLNGSDLIAIPASLTSSTREALKARAVENCVPVVLSNCFECTETSEFPSESVILNGDEEHSTSDCENRILSCEIDIHQSEVKSLRQRILSHRHPSLYEGVLVDLTSPVLRWRSTVVDEPQVSIVTISGRETFQNDGDFTQALNRIRSLAATSPVLVVLPEFPYEMSEIQDPLALVQECGVYTVCGFVEDSHVVICLSDRDGKELMRYKKVHLSDCDERHGIRSGDRLEFYQDLPMGRVAILAGEDLIYPESTEILRNCAVDLILAPANLNSEHHVVCKDVAASRHINLAVADYNSQGGIYKRSPNPQVVCDAMINSLTFDTQEGKLQPAKGLPAIPLLFGETIVRR